MPWKVSTALEKMAGRPTDLTRAEQKERLAVCQNCPKRVGEKCHPIGQLLTVHALKSQNRCPLRKWSGPAARPASPRSRPAQPAGEPTNRHTSPDFTLETPRIAKEITIGFTAMNRPHLVRRLYDSIRKFYPTTRVVIGENGGMPADLPADDRLNVLNLPFDCGISAARNAMVDALETPYLFLLDDDFVLTNETDLSRLLAVLDDEPRAACAGGIFWDYRANKPTVLMAWAMDIEQEGRVVKTTPAAGPLHRTPEGIGYYLSDTAQNFALFRVGYLQEHPWDERYKVQEHFPFYWEMRKTNWTAAVVESCRAEHRREITPEYVSYRNRNREAWHNFEAAEGLDPVKLMPHYEALPRYQHRPNLVVYGIGNSGTTPAVKMAHALGWHPGDADETFGESVGFRQLNNEIIQTGTADSAKMADFLATLPQPWAIKDPRIIQTLEHWRPLLNQYNAALVWITRDPAAVMESRRKRGDQFVRGGPDYNTAYHRATVGFESWTGPKLRVDFERLTEAASLISFERAAGGTDRLERGRAVDVATYVPGWTTPAELGILWDTAAGLAPGARWVELGTYAGRSLTAAGLALPAAAELVAVDHEPAPELNRHVEKLRTARPDVEIRVLIEDTAAAAERFDDESVDVVFVDADHSRAAVGRDVRNWWPKVKPGGRMIGHDYNRAGVRAGIQDAGLVGIRTAGKLWWAENPE